MNTVCIISDGGGVVLTSLMGIRDSLKSRIISAPVEDGWLTMDHKVRMPRTVEVSGTVSFVAKTGGDKDKTADEIMGELRDMFEDTTGKTFTVISKSDVIGNLICESMDTNDTPDKFDAQDVTIVFKELITVDAAWRSYAGISEPAVGDNADTSKSGTKTLSASPSESSSSFGNAFTYVPI